jgi:hypothetical protein
MNARDRNVPQKGAVTVIMRDRSGKVVSERKVKNMIVSSGRTLVANLFRGFEKRAISHLALGSGKKEVEATDANLVSELKPRRTFDANEFEEEKTAWCSINDAKGTECIRVTSLIRGSEGNTISIKIKKEKKKAMTVMLDKGDIHEVFEDVASVEDVKSNLVAIEQIKDTVPEMETDWIHLQSGSDPVVVLSATFGYNDCNGKICESGLFNASEGGIMYNRVVFPEIVKTSDLTLTMVWRITF